MKAQLERIVVPVFCTALIGTGEDKKAKLNKVRSVYLWHTGNNVLFMWNQCFLQNRSIKKADVAVDKKLNVQRLSTEI